MSLKQTWKRRQLERDLSKIVDLANGHKESGLPAGNELYKKLLAKAQGEIRAYSESFGVSISEICMGIPAIRDLESLANGENTGTIQKVLSGFVGVLVLSILVTAFVALNHDLYVLLTHWANNHWR